ncbi:MAG: carbon-nitrogen family hydrolase [Clostridiales bacterium]
MKVKVSLIKFNIALGAVLANEEKIELLINEAAKKSPNFICLPELWNTGYDLANLHNLAQSGKGTSISLLRNLAKKNNTNIIGGSIVESHENKFYNMMPAINAKGVVVEKYRKVHLFPMVLEESKYFQPGDKWSIMEIDDILVGMMLCYDLRFPEFCRNIVLRGAKIIFISAQWPRERLNHWRVMVQSRAIENQVFVVAVNRVGNDDSSCYSGHSMVVDPMGNILVEGDDKEGVLFAELDLTLVEDVRKKIPTLADRLNILDEIDNNFM